MLLPVVYFPGLSCTDREKNGRKITKRQRVQPSLGYKPSFVPFIPTLSNCRMLHGASALLGAAEKRIDMFTDCHDFHSLHRSCSVSSTSTPSAVFGLKLGSGRQPSAKALPELARSA